MGRFPQESPVAAEPAIPAVRFGMLAPWLAALALAHSAVAAPPPLPLRAADGPQVALLQAEPNPNKPYVAQLFAPGEPPIPLLDDSPPDHFHHHGLMFAVAVDDADFWAEKGIANAGRQQPVTAQAGQEGDRFTRRLQWTAVDGVVLLDESRRVGARVSGSGAETVHWLDWQSTLTPAAGRDAVRLSGHHYHGLGMRFLPAWTKRAEWILPGTTGQTTVRGDEQLTPGPWCAVRCDTGGRIVTLLMVDHPANPRPARWFTMRDPFCYLSAALGLDAEPATLAKGTRWTLRYGIAVMTGNADAARLAKLAEQWRNFAAAKDPPSPTPAKP